MRRSASVYGSQVEHAPAVEKFVNIVIVKLLVNLLKKTVFAPKPKRLRDKTPPNLPR